MNLIAFSVNNTNVFPISNSHAGGQLLTEYNLRSRESVLTDKSIEYPIGQSYTHSDRDFRITQDQDGSGVVINASAIQISEGRAIVNGHYVESLTPVVIDLMECNAALAAEGKPLLSGNLCVGLRIMYSTTQTMSGAMLVEDQITGMYEGIQIVILPKEGLLGERFTLPSDSPTDESKVNAHLKLGEFQFQGGSVLSIKDNADKSKVMSADRLSDVASFISDTYLTKSGLNAQRLYTFAGKGTNPSTGVDSWCDSTDSLMIWDQHPTTTSSIGVTNAVFQYDVSNDTVNLVLPHKQVDGMEDTQGNPLYYKDKVLNIPSADYGLGTGGVVSKSYTNVIKSIDDKIKAYYTLPNGKLRYYYGDEKKDEAILTNRADLPKPYNNSTWIPGDYVLVRQDATVYTEYDYNTTSSIVKYPTTMYIVLPGHVLSISYFGYVADPDLVPVGLEDGTEVGNATVTDGSFDYQNISVVSNLLGIPSTYYRGIVNKDYFRVSWVQTSGGTTNTFYYFYKVADADVYSLSNEPLIVTGQIALATENVVGGFLNVDADDAQGGGYVYRDSDGHLRVVDYSLLASGALAYQLGHNLDFDGTTNVIQTNLDKYVNQRVVFPDSTQIKNVMAYNENNNSTQKIANHIHIDIYLPTIDIDSGSPEEQELNIYDLDSRFSSSLHIHLHGGSQYNVVNIINCEKVKIYIEDGGSPKINLYKSCVYYDTAIIDYFTIIQDMSLWYEKFNDEDPDIQVNGMTVEMIGQPEIQTVEEFWSTVTPNDNHYSYAVRSITFGPDGTVTGIGMLVTDNVTGNIADGSYVFACPFTLPQSQSLPYPPRRMTKTLKVAGNFVTAYPLSVYAPEGYKIKNNSFTAMTSPYVSGTTEISGTISFLTHIESVTNVAGIDPTSFIDGWDSNHYYIFYGGAVD